MDVGESGEVSAYVYAPGHSPGRGIGLDPASAGDFTLRRKERSYARITVRGEPVAPGMLGITDITDDDRKVLHTATVGPDGKIDATWLEERRHYWLVVAGGRAGDSSSAFVTWDGRKEIELTGLETSFDDFWAGVRRAAK
jgi:hypothetical protein